VVWKRVTHQLSIHQPRRSRVIDGAFHNGAAEWIAVQIGCRAKILTCQSLAEVPITIILDGHGVRDRRNILVVAVLLEIEKEKRFVAAVVNLVRQVNRAADSKAPVMSSHR